MDRRIHSAQQPTTSSPLLEMYCAAMPMPYGYAYAVPTHRCGPPACSTGSSIFWRAALFMLTLSFAPCMLATIFALLGVAFRIGVFVCLATGLTSLIESAASSSCCPCPLSAAKKWTAKHACPCKPSKEQGEARQVKPLGTERASMTACCSGQKRSKPPPATHLAVEVGASAEDYNVTVDVPGIAQDELAVSAQSWSARSGELPRLTVHDATEASRVHRTLVLPRDADAEQASVTYAHGQLKISVPRAKQHALSIAVRHAATPAAAAAPAAATPPAGAAPVISEVTPDASNVQLPQEEAAVESENEWEELPQKE